MTHKLTLQARIFSVLALLIWSTLIVVAQNPVPFIGQPLVPDATAPGAPGAPSLTFTLTVNGTGFVPASTVNWNGSARTTAFVNGSRLVAFILSSDIALPSTASITVVSPAPGGGTSNAVFLPIHDPSSTLAFRRTDYVVGGNPQYAETADFNRDGKLDLVIANYGTGMVQVLLGNGDGTFQSHQDYFAGGCAQIPIIGDFNGDGILDLAVPYCSGVAVLLGHGDGTFGPAVSYPVGTGSIQGITADFNGDGKLDLAIGGFGTGVSILLGNGDGTFQPYVNYPVPGGVQTGVIAGDFNRDGKLDLAVANWGANTVSILLGNGDGTFQAHVDYSTGTKPGVLSLADFNGDGKLDLAVPNQTAGSVSILLGNGDGTFRPHVDYLAPHSGGADVADFNQDGKLDVVVAGPDAFDILLGNGDGTFQVPITFPSGNDPWNPLAADFNGDGRIDVANSNFGAGTVSVFLAQSVAEPSVRPGCK